MSNYLFVILLFLYTGSFAEQTYNADGNPYARVQNVKRQPVTVIDTVHFNGDSVATLVLNNKPSETKTNVSGDAWLLSAVQQDVAIARDSINRYALYKQVGDTITIWSSDADDTATVVLVLWVL